MNDVAVKDGQAIPARRASIMELQNAMLQHQQVDIKTRHYFGDGTYAREITIPAGVLIVGKIHKYSQINMVTKGAALVATDDGVELYEAPCTFVAKPGAKRVIYALSECIWTNLHHTFETDLVKIESELISPSFEDFDGLVNKLKGALPCRGSQQQSLEAP